MFIPKWLLALFGVLFTAVLIWSILLVIDRNPLPFPDRGSRIFTAASPSAKDAVVELLSMHGLEVRFQADSASVRRSILWDGTIINQPSPEVMQKLANASSSIGIVVDDPSASANDAAEFLRSRGFTAQVVLDVEPDIPIAFVVTDAMLGTVLNFRKHLIHLPPPNRQ